jgi:tRNA pseudouridine13 synthase
MRFKVQPEDFVVEERAQLPLSRKGAYALYQVRKCGVTTLDVQARMAAELSVPRSAVLFPALKDRNSVALQHASLKGTGPAVLEGHGYSAQFVGRASRPLQPRDLQGNHFTFTLRDMDPAEAHHIRVRLSQVERFGLPNYFDRQRFGSYVPGQGFAGKQILERDEEGALRAYLSQPFRGDPPEVRAFKSLAREHWGEWERLFEAAPRPSNLRSVLTFLKDHPADFRKALNLVTPRLLSLWLSAYQSFLWNRTAGRYLGGRLRESGVRWVPLSIGVAGQEWPLYRELPEALLEALSEVKIPLLHHRVTFSDPRVAAEVERVLAEEGLRVWDFKARVLKRAYVFKGERALLLLPQEVLLLGEDEDDCFPGKRKVRVAFFLPRGGYATLVLKALAVE